jgi:hypothetical protein
MTLQLRQMRQRPIFRGAIKGLSQGHNNRRSLFRAKTNTQSPMKSAYLVARRYRVGAGNRFWSEYIAAALQFGRFKGGANLVSGLFKDNMSHLFSRRETNSGDADFKLSTSGYSKI